MKGVEGGGPHLTPIHQHPEAPSTNSSGPFTRGWCMPAWSTWRRGREMPGSQMHAGWRCGRRCPWSGGGDIPGNGRRRPGQAVSDGQFHGRLLCRSRQVDHLRMSVPQIQVSRRAFCIHGRFVNRSNVVSCHGPCGIGSSCKSLGSTRWCLGCLALGTTSQPGLMSTFILGTKRTTSSLHYSGLFPDVLLPQIMGLMQYQPLQRLAVGYIQYQVSIHVSI